MLINWFTIVAQIINFLILVWLLKRYLYKPILKAIADREKKIANQLEDAETKKAEAEKEHDVFQKKNEDFDKQQTVMMNKAIADAKEERQRLFDQARSDAKILQTKLSESLKEEQKNITNEIRIKTVNEVFAIARKALTDLASLDLEEQMVNVFVQRIKNISETEKKELVAIFKPSSVTVTVNSAFELTQQQQTKIEKAVNGIFTVTSFNFKRNPEIVSGIEMNANGYKLSWNIAEYLSSIEKEIKEN